ncbi:hypothetical protein LguiA_007621 [Lonicera macranthoides]
MVPIVDGFNNNQILIPLAAKSSKKKMNSESEKSLQDLRAGGQGLKALCSSHYTPSSADELTEFHEKKLCAETSALEVCSEGLYGNLVDSHDSLADDFDEPVPEYGFVSNAKPSLDHVNQRIQGSNNAQMQPLHNEVPTKVLQMRANFSKVKQESGCSQDISQISGPDEKSKPTPLGQIRFRDTANASGGQQQLTLLSIELIIVVVVVVVVAAAAA